MPLIEEFKKVKVMKTINNLSWTFYNPYIPVICKQ